MAHRIALRLVLLTRKNKFKWHVFCACATGVFLTACVGPEARTSFESTPELSFQGNADISIAKTVNQAVSTLIDRNGSSRMVSILEPTIGRRSGKKTFFLDIFNDELTLGIGDFRTHYPRKVAKPNEPTYTFDPTRFKGKSIFISGLSPISKAQFSTSVQVSDAVIVQFVYLTITYNERQEDGRYQAQAAVGVFVHNLAEPEKSSVHIFSARNNDPGALFANLDEMDKARDKANEALQNTVRELSRYTMREMNRAEIATLNGEDIMGATQSDLKPKCFSGGKDAASSVAYMLKYRQCQTRSLVSSDP